jgi:hypothetical protein
LEFFEEDLENEIGAKIGVRGKPNPFVNPELDAGSEAVQ